MFPTTQGSKRKEKETPMKFKSLTKGTSKEMERNTGVAGSKTSPKNVVTAEHDYNRSKSPELMPLPDSDPDTPARPDGKKHKGDITLADVQNNIATLINERSDNLEAMISKKTVNIEAMKKSIDFMFLEIESLKNVTKTVKATCEKNSSRMSQVELKVNEVERYHRRWNLRLSGVAEQKQEDITRKALDICCTVAGETRAGFKNSSDVVHRLGRYSEAQKKPRLVIIRFVTRSARDLIWRKAKNCSFLKENHMRFTEDLSSADRAIREKLWPLIDAPRKEGKRAHFAGVHVIIEGKEMHPTLTSPEDQAASALMEASCPP
ncbi:unnamed protein product [Oreochromis niloticus]|nr:unnamed protein product [Mustela putorius furo]